MALKTYSPDANRIIHNTKVDFASRSNIFDPVHLVQYDDRLPILAVSLYNGGEEYAAPSTADANIRLSKKGHKFVSSPALGCSTDRKIIYFEISLQMMVDYGKTWPIIELVIGDQVAGSSPILFIIDKNPIQEGDIESTDEFKDIKGFVQEAKDAATQANSSKTAAANSASAAKQSETNANNSKTAAASSASEAKASQTAAKQSETNANASKEAAAASEENAETYATKAESYAVGDTATRPGEDKDNAKYYYENTLAVANSLTGALKPKGNITFTGLKALVSPAPGDFYNVTEAFTSDATFVDGSGIDYPAGSDVYYTSDSKWNVVQGPGVTGIKGSAESNYRKGQVEIDKDDIGLDQVDNTPDAKKNVASAGKVTNALTVGTKTYDGSETIEIVKDDLGLSNVENKSAETILGEMDKQNVVDALGYTPAGGENLVLDSGTEVSNANYPIKRYYLSEPLKKNEKYTLTIWGDFDNADHVEIYIGGGSHQLIPSPTKIKEGVWCAKEAFPADTVTETEFSYKYINVYAIPRDTHAVIHRIKLERGTVTDPIWTPAPEDIATHTDVEQAVTGENLVLGSDEKIVNSNYMIHRYTLSEKIELNQVYTVIVKADLGAGKTGINVNAANGENTLVPLASPTGNVYIGYGILSSWTSSTADNVKNGIELYMMPRSVTAASTIYSVTVIKGHVSNPFDVLSPYDQLFHALNPIAEMHRNIFRGRYLGDTFTDAQKAAIKAGTFDDIWLGDYWVINNHTWRVADINYWLKKGDKSCETNHVCVVPDANLYTHRMNESNTTVGGYTTSEMRTSGLDQAKATVNIDFGEAYVLKHRNLFTTTVVDGHPSAGSWTDSTVDLMNEVMVYGSHFFAPANNGVTIPYLYTIDNMQLALFRLCPRFINLNRAWYWLRDVVSAAAFASVGSDGGAYSGHASYVGGVRPVVGITGGN